MHPRFELSVQSVEPALEIPATWSGQDCAALLLHLEFEDIGSIPAGELRDFAVMALQELEPAEAARALLDTVFGSELSDGKKQNLAEEMTVDRCWEEYPDLECHERIFNAQVLLHRAHSETPEPGIVRVGAVLSALDAEAAQVLAAGSGSAMVPEPLLVRCIAAALPERAILNRLFEDPIAGGPFAEAEHLVWHVESTELPPEGPRLRRVDLSLYSPVRWLGDLEPDLVVECEPHVDDGPRAGGARRD